MSSESNDIRTDASLVVEVAALAIEEEPSSSLETVISISAGEGLVPVLSVKVDSPQSRFSRAQIADWEGISMKMFEDAGKMFARYGPAFERGDFTARSHFVQKFGWAVPDLEACENIVSKTTGDIISIGCGLCVYEFGMLPFLAKQDRNIACTDIKHQPGTFMSMKRMPSLEAVKTLGSEPEVETCFFSWPTYNDPHTVRALKARSEPFPYVVYIGEDDGCTGDGELHEYLRTMYSCIEDIVIPNWMDIHDSVRIFKRKE